jgi:hypothetical protein
MKKLIQEAKYDIICDTCGRDLDFQLKSDRIRLTILDTDYDFCSLECLLDFINAESTKERLNDRIY